MKKKVKIVSSTNSESTYSGSQGPYFTGCSCVSLEQYLSLFSRRAKPSGLYFKIQILTRLLIPQVFSGFQTFHLSSILSQGWKKFIILLDNGPEQNNTSNLSPQYCFAEKTRQVLLLCD